jgi:hypothetical protein
VAARLSPTLEFEFVPVALPRSALSMWPSSLPVPLAATFGCTSPPSPSPSAVTLPVRTRIRVSATVEPPPLRANSISIVPRPRHGARIVHATLQAPPDRYLTGCHHVLAGRPRMSLCGNMVCGMGWQTGWRKLANTLPIGISRVARGRRAAADGRAPPARGVSDSAYVDCALWMGWWSGRNSRHLATPHTWPHAISTRSRDPAAASRPYKAPMTAPKTAPLGGHDGAHYGAHDGAARRKSLNPLAKFSLNFANLLETPRCKKSILEKSSASLNSISHHSLSLGLL